VTNEIVTLIATVTSSRDTGGLSGAITFMNGTTSIDGCASEPVEATGQSVTVVCRTSFVASVVQLGAVFTPADDANLTGSASPTDSVTVGPDSTSLFLDAPKTAEVGASVSYTATVTSPPSRLGPVQPSGTITFFDGGQAIAPCVDLALIDGTATCTVTYSTPSKHTITVKYGGDEAFTGSVSSAATVNIITPPPLVRGVVMSTMQWTFAYHPTYTTVLALQVSQAMRNTVTVTCRGEGCRFAKHAMVVNRTRRCGSGGAGLCPTHGRIDLAPEFRKQRLSVGAQITVAITRAGWIGKYYRFTVRARRAPRVTISCLAPGRTVPGRTCTP
jgi:hypothetical protein